jgi:hypothetical protein
VTEDAQQSLPGNAFFFPECLAEISQNQQLVLHAALAKCTATNSPTSHTARKNHLHCVTIIFAARFQTCCKSQLLACPTQQSRCRLGQQLFTSSIHEPQSLQVVKRKDCQVDLGHYRSQQGRRL